MQIIKERWGTVQAQEVYLFTLTNAAGSIVKLTNYGARIVAIQVPDNQGRIEDIALGFDQLAPYLEDKHFMGATIGRFANRISNARFTLDHQVWNLEANEGPHCNHSAGAGFDHQVFDVLEASEVASSDPSGAKVVFSLTDEDKNGGFPGNLKLKITYSWAEKADRLNIAYDAISDRRGILNLTNHCYFNLFGPKALSEIFLDGLAQRLEINADRLLEMDESHIPTGRIVLADKSQVSGSILQQCIQSMKQNGRRVNAFSEPGLNGQNNEIQNSERAPERFMGLNSCFELRTENKPFACRLISDRNERILEVTTSYPGLLVYTGDSLDSKAPGHLGRPYKGFDGVALECQYYPDAPNRPEFRPAIIEPGKPYHEYITYTFSVNG